MLDALNIYFKARKLTHPIMLREAERLNIPYPKVYLAKKITFGEEKAAGIYRTDGAVIISREFIEDAIKEGYSEENILFDTVLVIFHEFKHYIDHKAYGITVKEYARNNKKYEKEADKYSFKMVKELEKKIWGWEEI